ncbi:MAG: 1-acyl-sn-glycerol-3-phosphate acyltransferase [Deltaproteobacteria bacterium]|nr:1-acyl-sn-glycerol-3-phosphate acyltransferase [Deltaproteobacteria bacterium]
MLRLLSALRRFPIGVRTSLYLTTLAVPRGALTRAMAGRDGQPAVESDPSLRDPEFFDQVMDLVELLAERYFRWDFRGAEHVPATGAALLVGNHNGGIVNTDSLLTLVAVRKQHGPQRAVYSLAHDMVFFDPVLGRVASRIGVLRAGHAAASRALDRGDLVLVYPGSDLDTWRPFWHRNRIELGGRMGFLKLALRQRVPIVPVVSAGTHEQMVVLFRGEEFARKSGLKRHLRAEAFPIMLAVPWGIASGYLPYLPLPAQTTIAFGKPIRWDDLGPEDAESPEVLGRCYDRVRREMQSLLDTITVGRRWMLGQRMKRAPSPPTG